MNHKTMPTNVFSTLAVRWRQWRNVVIGTIHLPNLMWPFLIFNWFISIKKLSNFAYDPEWILLQTESYILLLLLLLLIIMWKQKYIYIYIYIYTDPRLYGLLKARNLPIDELRYIVQYFKISSSNTYVFHNLILISNGDHSIIKTILSDELFCVL